MYNLTLTSKKILEKKNRFAYLPIVLKIVAISAANEARVFHVRFSSPLKIEKRVNVKTKHSFNTMY